MNSSKKKKKRAKTAKKRSFKEWLIELPAVIWDFIKFFIQLFLSLKDKNMSLKDKLLLIIVVLAPMTWLVFSLLKTVVGVSLLQSYGIQTKALVSSSVIYSIKRGKPQYLYVFKYEGNEYRGNSLIYEKDYQRVGDSIDILYLDFWPSMNRPTYYFK